MTPKEKAQELVEKFKNDLFIQRNTEIYTEDAILCALIAVDELIDLSHTSTWISTISYYKEVKQEIEKL